MSTPPTPKISINFAITLDGKISTRNGSPAQFTSDADSYRFQEIRLDCDAILVGRKTQETDNMSMTVQGKPDDLQPARCIISNSGNFDFNSKVFRSTGGRIHLIIPSGNKVIVPHSLDHYVDLHYCSITEFINVRCSNLGIKNLLCEGGGMLVKELFHENLIDIVHLTWAGHTLFGGQQAPTITGLPGDFLPASAQFKLTHFEPNSSGEAFLTYHRA